MGGHMGVIGALGGLLSGRGRYARPLTFGPGESELARECASLRPGTSKSVGGDLVLTNQRLVFTPLETADVSEVLAWSLKKAGAPAAVGALVGMVNSAITSQQIQTADDTVARPGTQARPLCPPTIVITSQHGDEWVVGVVVARLAPNWDSRNNVARDRMIQAIADSNTA